MIVRLIACLSLALAAFGQIVPPAPATPASLPPYVAAIGASDNRGAVPQYSVDVTVAVLIQKTNLFWWNHVSTPIGKASGGQALASTIETGAAWVAAQSGRVSLVFILLSGLSIAPAPSSGSNVSPNVSASVGVSIRLSQHWAVMPYIKALATTAAQAPAPAGTTPNGIATIVQPAIEFQYLFQ
jgi:hypothetical protein